MEDEDYNEDDDDVEEDEEESKYENGDITEAGKPYLKLIGQDGNVFNIIGLAHRAARKAKWSDEKIKEYDKKVMSGDYDNALATTMEYFDVC